MSDQDFVYGVYTNDSNAAEIVEELHKSGFNKTQIGVLARKSDQFKRTAGKIEDPTLRYMIRFGIAGMIGGLVAGICGAPVIPVTPTFQILTPMMAAVSGGIVLGYFGFFMGAFFLANKPQHWAYVFEGAVQDGDVIVFAEPNTAALKQSAWDIFNAHDPIEVTVRKAVLFARPERAAEEEISSTVEPVAKTEKVTVSEPTLSAVA